MTSPAEQYAAARRRQKYSTGPLGDFRQQLGFELDPFQVKACESLADGRSVLVAAPTGAGKTVVGEFAIHLALKSGTKAFYTTPIKALSNQKFAELTARYGCERVGLLTGDATVNGTADIVVMTTEVLRNMLYSNSPTLTGLGFVVMDEVHYLADRFRGPVWEEVIIHLPDTVTLVSLSATVSNAEEFGDWLDTVRGDTDVIVDEHRPVPLYQHIWLKNSLHDLFLSGDTRTVSPQVMRLAQAERHRLASTGPRPPRGGKNKGNRHRAFVPPVRRSEVIRHLDQAGLLPAITFVFSRAGCDAAVKQCVADGIRLTNERQAQEIRAYVEAQTSELGAADLDVLGYWDWLDGLQRGFAAHHAGLLPRFKEVVEKLFSQGLVRCVFATETLALGINMPARTVVLEKLVKWNGETHADITAGEFTQLTGRAGRRGIDVDGHAVVIWQPGCDPAAVAGLASTRTYPLRSSFRPTYNMAANLVAQFGRDRARDILQTSFAQFQADRAVVGLARKVRHNEQKLAEYASAMACHLGDFADYAQLRRELSERERDAAGDRRERRRAEIATSLQGLTIGSLLRITTGRRPSIAVVIEADQRMDFNGPMPRVLGADRQIRRLSSAELREPVVEIGRLAIPKNFSERSAHARRDLAAAVLAAGQPELSRSTPSSSTDHQVQELRRRLRAHSCHGCSDREGHARWAVRWATLRRETDELLQRIDGRTGSVARTFDQVCSVLQELGYLTAMGQITEHGQRLRRLYTEHDLLAAQCLRQGIWEGIEAPALAACLTSLVHEARREGDGRSVPPGLAAAVAATHREWKLLLTLEAKYGLRTIPEPDDGLTAAMLHWASGEDLETVLRDCDLAAGDFVRRAKQLVDVLGQIGQAGGSESLRKTAQTAITAILRGVVVYGLPQEESYLDPAQPSAELSRATGD